MVSTPEQSGPAVALLFDDQSSGQRLREVLEERGARIVLEAGVSAFEVDVLPQVAADVVVVNLDPGDEDALERVMDALGGSACPRLVLNDAEVTRSLAGWDAARWARHLAAKILGTDIDPPRPIDAIPVVSGLAEAILNVQMDDLDGPEATASLDQVPADSPPEPAMNAALAHEIEALLDADASVATSDMASLAPSEVEVLDALARGGSLEEVDLRHVQAETPVQDEMAGHPSQVAEDRADDLDALLASLGVFEPSAPGSGAASNDAEARSARGDLSTGIAEASSIDLGNVDLDALLAEFPDSPGMPPETAAIASTEPSAGTATSFEEPIPVERLPPSVALAHPQTDSRGEDPFGGSDLEALLAEILPREGSLQAPTEPMALPESDPGGDPLLSSLAGGEQEPLSSVYADFDPETWQPPTVAVAPSSDAGSTDGGEAPPAAEPVRVGESAPDLELMLDEMFEQPIPAASAPPVQAPDWGLLDDAAPESKVDDERPSAAQPIEAMDLSGLELMPFESGEAATTPPNGPMGRAQEILRVVAVGASIGGPDAVREFLSSMQPGLPVLVLVAQHLDAAFFTSYAEQFTRALLHPVRIAKEGMRASAGDVVLIPPGERIDIDPDGRIHARPAAETRYTPSIDDTLSAIADAFGPRALALIFSGMASDGLRGMARIMEKGGQLWTQSPSECVVSAMVDAARAAGYSGFSGAPAALAERLNAELMQG